MVQAVREDHPVLVEDRPLEQELRALIARLQGASLSALWRAETCQLNPG